uniref:Uncharacterized protein n=1 Tax=Arundo donax TaxID=35708 RepID=A0A0A8Z292_ARUDO
MWCFGADKTTWVYFVILESPTTLVSAVVCPWVAKLVLQQTYCVCSFFQRWI